MHCGVDITKIDRFSKFLDDEKYLKKYFTSNEIEYIFSKQNKLQTIAGLYASKEAFLKALGNGIGRGLNLADINILHDKNGKPFIEITPQIQYHLINYRANDVCLSISHDGEYAVAFCVLN